MENKNINNDGGVWAWFWFMLLIVTIGGMDQHERKIKKQIETLEAEREDFRQKWKAEVKLNDHIEALFPDGFPPDVKKDVEKAD